MKLRGLGHEYTLKEIAQSLTVFFAIKCMKKKLSFCKCQGKSYSKDSENLLLIYLYKKIRLIPVIIEQTLIS